jgi:predicted transcriptional regulator
VTHPITGPSRDATAQIIARFANAGIDDPRIAARLGITVAQVRGIRRRYRIEAGEQRWLGTRAAEAPRTE